jgi:4-oxalocrotonate tautomerase
MLAGFKRSCTELVMPIINIKIAPLSPVTELEEKVAAAVTQASTHILRKNPEVTAVVVERVDPKVWFAGGTPLDRQRKSSFWLEIKVVDGTNTKDEKEAFIAAVFAAMAKLLGDLHEESYVHVHEVIADSYGYGGLTQERRYIAAKLQTLSQERRAA